MQTNERPLRVLYSFPLKLGAARICTIAWNQVDGLAIAGAEVKVATACISRPPPANVNLWTTLARGRFRIPNRLLGRINYGALHDWIVSRYVEKNANEIDVIHTWQLGALRTLKTAARLGIPTMLERCNAHTRFAYEVVQKESERLGVNLPSRHEHAFNKAILQREEEEYRNAYRILCPSDFVLQSFVNENYPRGQLARHIYGVDETIYFPDDEPRDPTRGLTMISVGVCAVRKGIHFALEAWLRSPACENGQFLIAGGFLPAYQKKLAPLLAHPSVKVLGHRNDVPALVRKSDMLVLASIEEGFGLVCTEAMASGCVPLVSDACTDLCRHDENALVHHVGDVDALTQHITTLHENRGKLAQLRNAGLGLMPQITWKAAGEKLLGTYQDAVRSFRAEKNASPVEQR